MIDVYVALTEPKVPPTFGVLLHTWSWPLVPLLGLILTVALYIRGWSAVRTTRPNRAPPWRLTCFLGGIAAIWIAIASPIDAFDDYLLVGHMVQHFILMSIAPPLIVLGAPVVPFLRGLPRWFIRRPLGWFFRSQPTQKILHALTHPAVLWLAMNLSFLGWHVPRAFELTFASEAWHNAEHLSFLLTSLGFWFVVLNPWPMRARWPRWFVIPYLLSGDLVNTVLSASLTFSGRVLYHSYAEAPRICSLTPLQDQTAAGAEMWVLNSVVFIIPAVLLTVRLLSPSTQQRYMAAGPSHFADISSAASRYDATSRIPLQQSPSSRNV